MPLPHFQAFLLLCGIPGANTLPFAGVQSSSSGFGEVEVSLTTPLCRCHMLLLEWAATGVGNLNGKLPAVCRHMRPSRSVCTSIGSNMSPENSGNSENSEKTEQTVHTVPKQSEKRAAAYGIDQGLGQTYLNPAVF